MRRFFEPVMNRILTGVVALVAAAGISFAAVKDWSGTAASNTTLGSLAVTDNAQANTIDDLVRELMAQVATQFGKINYKGSDIASATTTDLSTATGNFVDITGTTTITGLGTVAAGQVFILKFEGALTLTHNGTSLIIPGGENITTAAGDVAIVVSEGSGNWRLLHYRTAASAPIITPWVTYTPSSTQGFGTPSAMSAWWRRIGDTCYLRVTFTAGTVAASEARISLPNSITSDATKVPAISMAGMGFRSSAAAAGFSILIESNVAYVTFGLQTAGAGGLSKANGNSVLGTGESMTFNAQIPITDW